MQRVAGDSQDHEGLVDVAEAPPLGKAEQELPVFRRRPPLVETARAPERVEAHGERARLHEHLLEEVEVHLTRGHEDPLTAADLRQPAREERRLTHERRHEHVAVVLLEIGEDGVDLGVFLEEGQLALQLVRLPLVVGVQERDEVAGGELHPGVPRGRHAGVRAYDVLQARILDGLQTIRRIVGRPIVHHEDVEIGVGLSERARDRAHDDVSAVVRGDDDGDVHVSLCCTTDTTPGTMQRRPLTRSSVARHSGNFFHQAARRESMARMPAGRRLRPRHALGRA